MAGEKRDAKRGHRIERLMDRQGWNPSGLSRVMRVDRGRIYDWRSGEPISSDLMERLAVALETTRLYIQSGEGPDHFPRGEAPELLLRQLLDDPEEQARSAE